MRSTRDRITTAAVRVLVKDPSAPLERVAEAAGVSRATLHRIFPGRAALISALSGDALQAVRDALHRATPAPASRTTPGASAAAGVPVGEADATSGVRTLERLVQELLPVAYEYGFLVYEQSTGGLNGHNAEFVQLEAEIREFVRAAQRRSELRVDLTSEWIVDALLGLVLTAADSVAAGRLARAAAAEAVTTVLFRGVRLQEAV
ncbi:MAG: TetR family transcriptional regulator [Streptosporangiales bacterium]|nr:TetR family transcriptional regulator [Streptosporangiales bacterium]